MAAVLVALSGCFKVLSALSGCFKVLSAPVGAVLKVLRVLGVKDQSMNEWLLSKSLIRDNPVRCEDYLPLGRI